MDHYDLILNEYPSADIESLNKYISICSENDESDYTELHHILPKSIFPIYKDLGLYPDNGIRLSYTNHCLAHYWLAKAINDKRAWFAVGYMLNSKQYENITETDVIALSVIDKSSVQKGSNNGFYGKSHTSETKELISSKKRGKPGHKHTPDSIRKMSESQKGEKSWRYGTTHSEEHKQYLSEINTGEQNGFYGKKHTPETRSKMGANKGKIMKDDQKSLIAESCKRSHRTDPIWEHDSIMLLWDSWNTNCMPKLNRFHTILKHNGIIVDVNKLASVVKHFFKVSAGECSLWYKHKD